MKFSIKKAEPIAHVTTLEYLDDVYLHINEVPVGCFVSQDGVLQLNNDFTPFERERLILVGVMVDDETNTIMVREGR